MFFFSIKVYEFDFGELQSLRMNFDGISGEFILLCTDIIFSFFLCINDINTQMV